LTEEARPAAMRNRRSRATQGIVMDSFFQELAEILDVNSVAADQQLSSFENWDSLTILSICALADSKYRVSLNASDFRSLETAGDLATVISERASR
jgi:acyl carrier protein